MALSLEELKRHVTSAAAIRRSRTFEPTAGPGASISPPTYPDASAAGKDKAVHLFEDRMLDGAWKSCVILDTVQSQANRFEDLFEKLAEDGTVEIPRLTVDVGVASVGKLSSLTVPHRIFDAILRDSLMDDGGKQKTLRKSSLGSRVNEAFPKSATAIFECSPNTLLFGGWNSTWNNKRGAKFARCIVSEIIGVDARPGVRAAGRMDPLNLGNIKIYQKGAETDTDPGYTTEVDKAAKKANKVVPYIHGDKTSAINHGMIPPSVVNERGVSVGSIKQFSVLNMASLRQLSFPEIGKTASTSARDQAARTVLAALGLVGLTGFGDGGVVLRSRCELVPVENPSFEVVGGSTGTSSFSLSFQEAIELFKASVTEARGAGLSWPEKPIELSPSGDFEALVRDARTTAEVDA